MTARDEVYEIRSDYVPGFVGRVTELHATYYGGLWKLGPQFEVDIAEGIAEFVDRYDPSSDGMWAVVDQHETVRGGIIIDGREADERGAQLRYFILDPSLHGNGLGRQLLAAVMNFCGAREFDRIFLWTVDELEAAIGLYRSVGFTATEEVNVHSSWETPVPYRLFEYRL